MTVQPIRLPRVNANDETAHLSAWLVEEWDPVRVHQPIALIETTKAVVELASTAAGLIVHAAYLGEEVTIGDPVAFLLAHKDVAFAARLKEQHRLDASRVGFGRGSRPVSVRAREAMTAHGLSIAEFRGSGPIRERDVAAVLASRQTRALTDAEQRDVVEGIPTGEGCLVLFGAALQGKVVVDCLGVAGPVRPVAFVDDHPKERSLSGLPVVSAAWLDAIQARGVRLAHVSIGDNVARLECGERLRQKGFEIVNVVHPSAVVSPVAALGQGVFIGPLALVGPEARIGDFVQINNAATVAHDSVLGRGARISDGAHLAGRVNIGERVLLGVGVSVNAGLTIGADSVVVSGVALYGDVPPRSIVRAEGKRYPASPS